jgi:hypothetical protein
MRFQRKLLQHQSTGGTYGKHSTRDMAGSDVNG